MAMAGIAVLALTAAACEVDTSSPLNPNPIGSLTHESFTGTLPVGGSRFYSFTVPKEGAVLFTLLSLRVANVEVADRVVLGVGGPVGTGCSLRNSVTTGSGPNPQFQAQLTPGVYCVHIGDGGTLTAPAAFAINIARPD